MVEEPEERARVLELYGGEVRVPFRTEGWTVSACSAGVEAAG